MGLVHPHFPAKGSMQSVLSNLLTAFWGDMLHQFQQETRATESSDFSLEELIVGSAGDHRGRAVLFDAHPSSSFIRGYDCNKLSSLSV